MFEITINPENVSMDDAKGYRKRTAVRAIVQDKNDNIGVLWVSKDQYHKLPGGGVDGGEALIDALRRECLEELGATISLDNEEPYLKTYEYRKKYQLFQESLFYVCTLENVTDNHLTHEEKELGFEIQWLPKKDILTAFINDSPKDYDGQYITQRDTSGLLFFFKNSI